MNNTVKRTNIQSLAMAGILCALIGVMSVVPYTGYISYGVVSITTLHIPVIVGAILLGPAWGTAIGTFWGVTCLLRAFLIPQTPFDLLFQNPLYSVFPRIMVGLIAGLVWRALSERFGNKREKLAFYLTGVAGAAVNTVLVLGLLSTFGAEAIRKIAGSVSVLFNVVLLLNGGLEILAAPFLIAAAAAAVKHTARRRL